MSSGSVVFGFGISWCLRGTTRQWVTSVLAACLSLPVYATSSPPSPTVYASLTSPYLTTTSNIEPEHAGKYPYVFRGIVTWPERDMVYTKGADVYFGILLPGGASVMSWTIQNGVTTLVPGYVPFARAIPNTVVFQAFDNNKWGAPINYTFSGSEPKGLYFVYLILTAPGADPNDSRQWRQVSTHPFVVK